MAARIYRRLTKELTFGTFQASAPSSDVVLLHITSNRTPVMVTPIHWDVIRTAAGNNLALMIGAEQKSITYSLEEKMWPTQAAWFMTQCFGITGSPLELPSFTLDEAYVMEDGTTIYRRYLGCKMISGVIRADNSPGGTLFSYSLNVQGKETAAITISDFAEPALSAYPTEVPFTFQDTAGLLTIGSVITNYRSVELGFTNIIKTDNFDEFEWVQRLPWRGRDVTLKASLLFKSIAQRAAYEGVTARTVNFGIDSGPTSVDFDMNTKNYTIGLETDMPMDSNFFQEVSMQNFLDPAAGIDLTVTIGT